MLPQKFEPLYEKRNFEKIIDLLKEKIFSGEFLPGDRLPSERDLAATLKVSVLSVRDAYKALQLLGMIETRRGISGGSFILPLNSGSSIQNMADLLRFRGGTIDQWAEAILLLEMDLGRLAIERASESDFARLKALNEEAFRKIETGVPSHRENTDFRIAWAETARNPFLLAPYRAMVELLFQTRTALHALQFPVETSRMGAMKHSQILEATRNRDFERLSIIFKENAKVAYERLRELSDKLPYIHEWPTTGNRTV
jgi:GntR family transcriptional regulator, transcriptional repressor for pyruvate dehydrogenase complex